MEKKKGLKVAGPESEPQVSDVFVSVDGSHHCVREKSG